MNCVKIIQIIYTTSLIVMDTYYNNTWFNSKFADRFIHISIIKLREIIYTTENSRFNCKIYDSRSYKFQTVSFMITI